jgi:hypothetical protein
MKTTTLTAIIFALGFAGVAAAASYSPEGVIVTSGTLQPSPAGKLWDIRAEQKRVGRPWIVKFKARYAVIGSGPFTVTYSYWVDGGEPSCTITFFVGGTAYGSSGMIPGGPGTHTGSFQTGESPPGKTLMKVSCVGKPDQYTMHWDELSVST